MGVTRKITSEEIDKSINKSFIADAPAGHEKTTPPETDTKTSVCFQMNTSTKKLLEKYCVINEISMTAGIKKAIREMLQRENIM